MFNFGAFTGKRMILTSLILILTLSLAGCPTGDKWQKAADASDKLITVVQTAQDTEISLYKDSHLLSPQEHIQAQRVFEGIAKADKALNVAIREGASSSTAIGKYEAAVDAVDQAVEMHLINVQNPTAALTIKGSLDSMKVILEEIKAIATKK